MLVHAAQLNDVTHAIVRAPASSFSKALSEHPQSKTINVAAAIAQHVAYVEALESIGVQVVTLPADDDFPDGCFVDDTAVVVGGAALVTRPGAPSRQGETASVADLLERNGVKITYMSEPATLDGGDVLRLRDRLVVGRSERTNEEGIRQLEGYAEDVGHQLFVVDLPPGILHLQTGVTAIDQDSVVGLRSLLDHPALRSATRRLVLDPPEMVACNAIGVGGHVLIAAGYPRVARLLEQQGFAVHALDISEFTKADGGLTCLSLLCELHDDGMKS